MNKHFATILLTALCTISPSLVGATTQPDELDHILSGLEAKYHVQIQWRFNPENCLPQGWKDPSLRMVAAPIHKRDAEALEPVIEQFLSAHPTAVIEQNLEHIYLLGKLSFQERDYGGTHTGKSMYIVWDRSRKYTPEFVLERLHSEFSSILRDQHAFPNGQWNEVNPAGFTYSGTGFEMLGSASIYDATETDQDNGFLVQYSKSSLENDFNIMSAWLFTRPAELDALGLQHERLQRKLTLTEAFYESLSDQYAFHQPEPSPSS